MADTAFNLDDQRLDDAFARRHIGPDDKRIGEMLEEVGASSLDDLIEKVTPPAIRSQEPLDLPKAMTERQVLAHLKAMADANDVKTSMIGMGYYGTVTPTVILRNVLENPGWYTAYTPYQAEISQGRLEVLLNFQQAIIDLTGLELANASLLDEATAAAEAMAMAKRVAKAKSDRFFVDADTHPQTLAVLKTRAEAFGFEIVTGDPFTDLNAEDVFGALLSYPGSSGEVRNFSDVSASLKQAGALSIMATDLLALVMLAPPAEQGADIAIGSAQRFGVPMGYGGPHAAFFATREAHKRAMPGRLIGVSVDTAGRTALRMALQTREQHIRREKSHQQHLHRPGATRHYRLLLHHLSRPRRPSPDRAPNPSLCGDPGNRAASSRRRGADQGVFRHLHRACARQGRRDFRTGRRCRDQPSAGGRRSPRHRL